MSRFIEKEIYSAPSYKRLYEEMHDKVKALDLENDIQYDARLTSFRDTILVLYARMDKQAQYMDFDYMIPNLQNRMMYYIAENGLNKVVKVIIEALIVFSAVTKHKETLLQVRRFLVVMTEAASKRIQDLVWMYTMMTSFFSDEQLSKLHKVWGEASLIDSVDYLKNDVAKRLEKKIGNVFLPDEGVGDNAQTPTQAEASSNSESVTNFLYKLIELFTTVQSVHLQDSVFRLYLFENDSFGLVATEEPIKEALIWKIVEQNASNREEFARLAGIIAFKNWFFKKPLLVAYCKAHDIDYHNLQFSKRAELTKKAAEFYSQKEQRSILDGATQKELERRKSRYQIEDREKFKGKRISLGVELEIVEPNYELVVMSRWYEMTFGTSSKEQYHAAGEYEKHFTAYAEYRDAKELLSKQLELIRKLKRLDLEFLNEGVEVEQEQVGELKSLLTKAIQAIINQEVREALLNYIQNADFGGIVKLYQLLIQVLEKELALNKYQLLPEKKLAFYQPFVSGLDSDSDSLTPAVEVVDRLKHLSAHHVGNIQFLDHRIKSDAMYELALNFVSADFRQPHRFLSRELWGLAQAGFHDLDTDSRPMHITAGFNDRHERLILKSIDRSSSRGVYPEASLIHTVLTIIGLGFRQYILDFKKAHEEAISQGKSGAKIKVYGDSSRDEIIRRRPLESFQREFRGFAPSKQDFPRLVRGLENLMTAMIPYLIRADGMNDEVDNKLAEIYETFRKKVLHLYHSHENFPNILDVNNWSYSESNAKNSSSYKQRKLRVENLYRVIAESFDEPTGFVADMRKIFIETQRQIEAVFEEKDKGENTPPDESEDKRGEE